MQVRIKLFASLRKYLPAGHATDTLTVELPDGAAVRDAIAALGIPAEHARMVVSENQQLDVSARLRDGQEINLFPPLAGGCSLTWEASGSGRNGDGKRSGRDAGDDPDAGH